MTFNELISIFLGTSLGAFLGIRLTVSWDKKKLERKIIVLLNESMYLEENKDHEGAAKLCEEIFQNEIIFEKRYRKYLEKSKYVFGVSYYNLANKEGSEHKLLRAINALKLAEEANQKTKNKENEWKIGHTLALCLWKMSFYRDKIDNVKSAIKKLEKVVGHVGPDDKAYGTVFNNWGSIYRTLGEVENQEINCNKSIEYFKIAEKYFQNRDDRIKLSDSQNNLGNAYLQLSQHNNTDLNISLAIAYFKKSGVNSPIENNAEMHAISKLGLSSAYSKIPAPSRHRRQILYMAKSEAMIAIKIFSDLKKADILTTAKINLGIIFQELSGYLPVEKRMAYLKRALDYYNESIQVWNIASHPFEFARIRLNMGNSFYEIARITGEESSVTQAIACYKESIEIWRKEKYRSSYGIVIHCMANSYLELAKITKKIKHVHVAISLCKHALRIRSAQTNPMEYCISTLSLGNAYLMALDFYRDRSYAELGKRELLTAKQIAIDNAFHETTELIIKNLKEIQESESNLIQQDPQIG